MSSPHFSRSATISPSGSAASALPAAERLVLVHGTFAAQTNDGGKGWWQLGSEAARALEKRMPAGVALPAAGKLFHWSGENNERARIKAAGDLLAYLRGLEREGVGYHLIGHSHGGSVIWHALRLGVLQGRPLQRLRSWATVGTPFMHLRPQVGTNPLQWLNLILAILLIKPAVLTCQRLVGLFISPESSYWLGGTATESVQRITFWETPVLWLLQGLGVAVETTGHGVKIGSFDPGQGQSATEFLFFSPDGWLILAVAALVVYVFLNLTSFCLSPLLEALRLRAEHRLEQKVFSTYGKTWLGLWSRDDEAINGLRATLDLAVTFVARMMTREPVLLSDYLALLSRPYYWLLTPLFNGGLRPLLNGMVRSFVVKTAQGNNRPSAVVVRVAPAPLASARDDLFPPLPSELNTSLVARANQHARNLGAEIRRLLAAPSFIMGLEQFGDRLSGRELVHTSYFDHPEIIDLLAIHICWAAGAVHWTSTAQHQHRGNIDWLRQAKLQLGVEMPPLALSASGESNPGLPPLSKPRRRLMNLAA